MKKSKLSKEKKSQLILVGLITVMLMVGIGYGLINFLSGNIEAIQKKKAQADRKLGDMRDAIKAADMVENQVTEAAQELAAQEERMVTGDKATWLYNTIRAFKQNHKGVDLPSFSTISEEQGTQLLPKFPYQEVTIKVEGTGHYHDIGKFIADFENSFPHIRLLNLEVWPSTTVSATDKDSKEKLSFRVDVVALVKPSAS